MKIGTKSDNSKHPNRPHQHMLYIDVQHVFGDVFCMNGIISHKMKNIGIISYEKKELIPSSLRWYIVD